jgi:hypothetical protein
MHFSNRVSAVRPYVVMGSNSLSETYSIWLIVTALIEKKLAIRKTAFAVGDYTRFPPADASGVDPEM